MALNRKQVLLAVILVVWVIGSIVLMINRLVPLGTFFILALIFFGIDFIRRKVKKNK